MSRGRKLAVLLAVTALTGLGGGWALVTWARLDQATWVQYQLNSPEVRLDAGEQVVYVAGDPRLGPDDVAVVSPDGAKVPVTAHRGEELDRWTYGFHSVASFDAASTGPYRIAVGRTSSDEVIIAPSTTRVT